MQAGQTRKALDNWWAKWLVGIRSGQVTGRTWGAKGHTPIVLRTVDALSCPRTGDSGPHLSEVPPWVPVSLATADR
ncbi:hypothetical protein [Streptomyces sp. Ag109_O5-1]|uniref:hypothetical protein n=1 Tax=Streptomyces sp. Ag109_O5-1 TaxID=1938851 RepID=UPI000F4DF8A9|nr:hypothetical protein [Streptomyces sp. Ag109_O5-1]